MLTSKDVRDYRIFSGIICHESAAAIHGLTDEMLWPVQIFSKDNVHLINNSLVYVHVDKISYDDTDHIGGLLYITNVERTICDLINKGVRKPLIYSAVSVYESKRDLDILRVYAGKYGCVERLDYFIHTLTAYWDKFEG